MIVNILKRLKPVRGAFERRLYRAMKMQHFVRSQKGAVKGRPMLIVGNGPSLNETPLDEFCDTASIGMNKINMIFERTRWRPSTIICTNGLVMRQNRSFYRESSIPIMLSMKAFFLGVRGPNVHYFLEREIGDFSQDASAGMGLSGTVTYAALQYAYYLEANPVVIVGVDHSFKLEGKTDANAIERRTSDDVNHFDPNYFAKGMAWGVPNLELSEMGYRAALAQFSAAGREVYDATVGGRLDIFPKIGISKAISYCSR